MSPEDRAYVLADMHLKPLDAPGASARHLAIEENKRLAAFLSTIEGKASRLILLGDTFNFWFERRGRFVGDYLAALSLFKSAADQGLAIHHVCGNRDFVVGEGLGVDSIIRHTGFFNLKSGFTVSRLADFGIEPHGAHYRLHQAGKTIVCLHGDSLCSGDRLFMLFRWLLQGPIGRQVFLRTPWWLMEPMISLEQGRTGVRAASRLPEKMLSGPALVNEVAKGADLLICGHVHTRFSRDIPFSGRIGKIEAIPAWLDGWYGIIEGGGVQVERFA
ncbi:MAG: hypothetical protein LBE84_07505 [Planctomycetota bacterium]|jgi:UDP-2,3-diacylglucosamine hydrolase|nr:hypothetical protein [Planctomycetota bacterium]